MKRIAFTLLFLLFLASACVPAGSQNAPTVSPALTLETSTHLTPDTPTPDTPTPEATATPTETPTPEVKQFPICQIENFRDCPITVDDLFNGNYLRWLNTLSKPFDQSKIKQVPMIIVDNEILYDIRTAPNFNDPSTRPFRRDVTAGHVVFNGNDYIAMPVEYFDPRHPDKNQWVITLCGAYSPGYSMNDEIIQNAIRVWETEMHITPIETNDLLPFRNIKDQLIAKTFDNNPDMADRFQRFVDGDISALSDPGIVLFTNILTTNGHWYQ